MPTFTDTKTLLGEDGALDALVSHNLTEFADSDLNMLGDNALMHHTMLKTIYLPNINSIGLYAFYNCTSMKNFYIGGGKTTVVNLGDKNAFDNTGHSLIRVKDDLVANYRNTTNWASLAARIYGENDSTAPEWDETEIADDMSTFVSHVNAGTAAERYNLGNYINIDLGTEGSGKAQIVAKNVRELANSTETAQLEFVLMFALNTDHRYNPAYEAGVEGTGTIGGYDKSELKTYIEETIWPLFPYAWREIIKECKISSSGYDTSGTRVLDMESTAKICPLSYREVFGKTTIYETTGPMYNIAFPDNISRVMKSNGSQKYWWLRTAENTSAWKNVNMGGTSSNKNGVNKYYIVLRFSV